MLCWLGTPHFKLIKTRRHWKFLQQQLAVAGGISNAFLSLLEKISKGGVDPVKSAKLLLAKGRISEDVEIVGCDEEGKLYKGLVGFMIVGLKQSIHQIDTGNKNRR